MIVLLLWLSIWVEKEGDSWESDNVNASSLLLRFFDDSFGWGLRESLLMGCVWKEDLCWIVFWWDTMFGKWNGFARGFPWPFDGFGKLALGWVWIVCEDV